MSKVGEYYRELEEWGLIPDNEEGEQMGYQTHNDINIKTSGSSYMGCLKLNYYDILNKLGGSQESDGYKVDAEWSVEFDDGTVATLYNWKDGRNYCRGQGLDLHQIEEWHVGGFSLEAFIKMEELFKEKK